jgi:hypothetical protein
MGYCSMNQTERRKAFRALFSQFLYNNRNRKANGKKGKKIGF